MASDAADHARRLGVEYSEPHERLTPAFRKEGDAYVMDFAGAGVSVEITNIEPSRSELHGLIRVSGTAPGLPKVIHQGRFNLVSTSARNSLVKYLDTRTDLTDWGEIIEQVCVHVLEAVREGEPTVRITDVPAREGARFRVDPLLIEGFPNVIFGPGGAGKSMIAAMIAIAVHGGWQLADFNLIPGPVLVCDWELDDVTYREICERLCAGFGIEMPDIFYRHCAAPLADEAGAISRFVAREGIQLVIVDSLGYAIGGDKTSQELTIRMFTAIRTWRVTTLCVDHITNDEEKGNRPYGSVYTVNSARALWRVRAEQEEGSNELNIGLFQTKANFGKQRPIGLKATFNEGSTVIERQDVRDMPAMRESLSASMRILTAMVEARRYVTNDEIVTATGLSAPVVRARLSDMLKAKKVTRIVHGPGQAATWGLASDREEPPA